MSTGKYLLLRVPYYSLLRCSLVASGVFIEIQQRGGGAKLKSGAANHHAKVLVIMLVQTLVLNVCYLKLHFL